MIKKCNIEQLTKCVEIAYEKNSIPENNSAYCHRSKESIQNEFEFLLSSDESLIVGYFEDGILKGILGCFYNPDNNWVDCLGPFFEEKWIKNVAKDMFLCAKESLLKAIRFNFFFDARNMNCHNMMMDLGAQRSDNEYILLLDKKDYKPQDIKANVIKYSEVHKNNLTQLYDEVFPGMYLTSDDIFSTLSKTREVFCVLDDHDIFAGFGVLKYGDGVACTAELFVVKENQRGKGYGWALLNAVVDSAFNNHNAEIVNLIVERFNIHARDLYYSCGFKLAVENEAFYISV